MTTLIQQGGPSLPDPDRWLITTNRRGEEALVPGWNSDVKNVIAWLDGVEAVPGLFVAHLDDLEHYALAIMAAVQYARQSAAEPRTENGDDDD